MRKRTLNDFIGKARLIHDFKYGYSEVISPQNGVKVKIICPKHGAFFQEAKSHLSGCGCPSCGDTKRAKAQGKDFYSFVQQANHIHDNKFDYTKVYYVDYKTPILLYCKKHGHFEVKPYKHIQRKQGCPKCNGFFSRDTKSFIQRAKKTHKDKYSYENTRYTRNNIKVEIYCPEHGVFYQTPMSHLMGRGCSKCSKKYKRTTEEVLSLCKQLHAGKYEYPDFKFKTVLSKMQIICPLHGEFEQEVYSHLKGIGCSKCKNESLQTPPEVFIQKIKERHKNTYDYSLTVYKGCSKKITIVCKKHGAFKQLANSHLRGAGCPLCCKSKGEKVIVSFLQKHNIFFEPQKTFKGCVDKKKLRFDFYLPEFNLCVEFDGIQHFKETELKYKTNLQEIQKRDTIKTKWCRNNKVKLLRIRYDDPIEHKLSNFLKSLKKEELRAIL